MSILDLNLTDIPEDHPVPKGEYLITLNKAEIKKSKASGDGMIESIINIITDEYEDVAPIYFYMVLPKSTDDGDTIKKKKKKIKRFCDAFSSAYTPSGFDLTSGYGHSAWALIDIEDSEEFGAKNVLERFLKAAE
jgi:hypothetical protein